MASDRDLLHAWRRGDRAAGSLLFERHFDAILRFFRNKVGAAAEDLVQRTFVAAIEGQGRFREDASFRTYLFGIAHNLLREHFRGRGRAGAVVDVDATSLVDLGESPTSLLGAREEERLLLEGLRRIPLASQVILELYFWESLTGAELGQVLGVPEDTARSRLRKAKREIAAAIRACEADSRARESTASNLDVWAAKVRGQFNR
ncbi:MAG TPA: RNA polymerase sigma factor [Nannocystaceae bacterium]|nr:RNA polymerase sigma factor [Nannocystaceae bacterium]